LIALIANARRSAASLPLLRASKDARFDSAVYGSPPTLKRGQAKNCVGLFEKTSFASNASGNLSGQARLTTGLERLREMRERQASRPNVPSPRSFDRMRFLFTMSDSPRPSAYRPGTRS
jgi:hypothetical protein